MDESSNAEPRPRLSVVPFSSRCDSKSDGDGNRSLSNGLMSVALEKLEAEYPEKVQLKKWLLADKFLNPSSEDESSWGRPDLTVAGFGCSDYVAFSRQLLLQISPDFFQEKGFDLDESDSPLLSTSQPLMPLALFLRKMKVELLYFIVSKLTEDPPDGSCILLDYDYSYDSEVRRNEVNRYMFSVHETEDPPLLAIIDDSPEILEVLAYALGRQIQSDAAEQAAQSRSLVSCFDNFLSLYQLHDRFKPTDILFSKQALERIEEAWFPLGGDMPQHTLSIPGDRAVHFILVEDAFKPSCLPLFFSPCCVASEVKLEEMPAEQAVNQLSATGFV